MQATVMAVTIGEMFICSKLGQNLSEMEVRTLFCKDTESNMGPVGGF